jgi:hypothetical protein
VSRRILSTVVAAAAIVSSLSCGSPVHDDQVAALGPDPSGEHTGPLHRPGQPCLTCHGSFGPSHTEFAIAGTVYRAIDDKTPVAGAIVTLSPLDGSDAVGIQTNSAGNFYVTPSKFTLKFPLHVTVSYDYTDAAGNPKRIDAQMASRISRDGSCADCHKDPASRESFGHIYIVAAATDWPN